ncbi:hypothetical protein [Gemmatimonas sp.]|uniref:hypothetical protein n=1 Tax=Gemmatimonas sp. TaxID=1962908 RepID=UPI0035618C98
MPLPTSMTTSRLLILSLLTVSGAVVSATAASVYAAGEPARRLPHGARMAGRIDRLTPAVLASAADPTQRTDARAQLLDAITDGACFSTREMLFGASADRHAALDRAINAMPGIPEAPTLRQQLHQRLDAFTAGAPRLHAATVTAGQSEVAMLRWLLPHTIEARVEYCHAVAD